jgi:hypothetical protein
MAAQGIVGDEDVFDGFQGAGEFMAPQLHRDHSRILSALLWFCTGVWSTSSCIGSGPTPSTPDDDHDDADLNGGVYARKKQVGKGSHGITDSRSRISTSTANGEPHRALPNSNNDAAQ